MENRDLERTEELLKKSKGKKNTKVVIIAIIAALVIAGIGGFAGVKAHKSKEAAKNLDQAEKYLAEGEYEQAVEAYTAAIDIDAKSAPAYLGRAKANSKLGNKDKAYKDIDDAINLDPKNKDGYKTGVKVAIENGDKEKADEYIGAIEKNFVDTAKDDIADVMMGCTAEDIACNGITCRNGDDLYVANMPDDDSDGGRGYITKIDKDGNKETVFKAAGLGSTQFIDHLNIWDGWIYYSLSGREYVIDGFTTELHRVRLDGTDDMKLDTKGAEFQRINQMAVINGKIYYTVSAMDYTFAELRVCDLDGTNYTKLEAGVSEFTSDGKLIFYSKWNVENGTAAIWRMDPVTAEKAKICDLNNILDKNGLMIYGDALYASTYSDDNGNTDMINKVDIKTGTAEKIASVEAGYPYTAAIGDGILYVRIVDDIEREKKKDSDYNTGFNAIDLKEGSADDFSCTIANEQLRLSDAGGVEYPYVEIDAARIFNSRLYFRLDRAAAASDGTDMFNELGPVFGNMALDGTDIIMYGYK